MKKWLIVILVIVAGAWGYTEWRDWQARVLAAKGPGRPTTSPVIQTNINFSVNAAGEISPVEQVSVRPEINGRLELLPVDIGDRVRKDDLLFKLDDKELQNQRASTETAVQRARLELEQARRNYQRAEGLHAEKLISQELYEDAKTKFELSQNSLERAVKELAIIEERLTKTKVAAPFDCTVLTRPISVGQAVSGSGGFNSGTEVLTIADLNSMIINAHVNQADVTSLRVGQEVEVAVEAVAGLKVTGTVERIAPQATIKNNIKGFAVRVLLKNVDQRIRPGMTANVRIPVAAVEGALAVPLVAVFTEYLPETGQKECYVFVQKGESFERRSVQVGVADYFYAEIQAGLSAGEVVSLELPKEEKERQAKVMAGLAPGEGAGQRPTGISGLRAAGAGASPGPGTNRPAPARPETPTSGPAGLRPGGTGGTGSTGTAGSPRPGGSGSAPR